jgi:hypothetical protein
MEKYTEGIVSRMSLYFKQIKKRIVTRLRKKSEARTGTKQ